MNAESPSIAVWYGCLGHLYCLLFLSFSFPFLIFIHIPFIHTQLVRKILLHTTQYKPPLPRKRSGTAQSNSVPSGSSVVMRNTNFSATYSVSGEDPSGHGEAVSSRTRKPSRTNIPRRQSSGGQGDGISRTVTAGRNLPGSTPTTHKPDAMIGMTAIRKTSFSRRAVGAVDHEPMSTGPGVSSRTTSGGGSIVKNTASRQLYSTYHHASDTSMPNDHLPTSGRHNTTFRGVYSGTAHGYERIVSNGGSDHSSSSLSEGEGQYPAVQHRRTLKRYAD